MNKTEVLYELAKLKADELSIIDLYKLCLDMNKHTPMNIIVHALEHYLWDSIDEVDYSYLLKEYQ